MEIRYKFGRKREVSLTECSLEELLEISNDVIKYTTKTAYYPERQVRRSMAWWLIELATIAAAKGGDHAIVSKIRKQGTFRFVGKLNEGILSWGCPYCKKAHSVRVSPRGTRTEGVWNWDGNIITPTLTPCITNACGNGVHMYINNGRLMPLGTVPASYPLDLPLDDVVKIVVPKDPDKRGKILRAFIKYADNG